MGAATLRRAQGREENGLILPKNYPHLPENKPILPENRPIIWKN